MGKDEMKVLFNNALINEMYSKHEIQFWEYYATAWEMKSRSLFEEAAEANMAIEQMRNLGSEFEKDIYALHHQIHDCKRSVNNLKNRIGDILDSLCMAECMPITVDSESTAPFTPLHQAWKTVRGYSNSFKGLTKKAQL